MTSDTRDTPSRTHLYGLYDPEGSGITFYKSAAERDEAAKETIQEYEAFGIWYQGVTGVFAFMATHCATCIDVARPVGETRHEKEGRYEADEYWPNTDCDYKWNYALKPFPTPEATNDVISPPVRYVLHPGYVTSASDGQEHFIDGPRLARLHGLNILNRNVVFGDKPGLRDLPGDIHLRPRFDGDYSVFTPEAPNV